MYPTKEYLAEQIKDISVYLTDVQRKIEWLVIEVEAMVELIDSIEENEDE